MLFGFLMFCKYSVAMLVSVFLLCPYSVKMSIKKFISLWRCFSIHTLRARERRFLDTPIAVCGAIFELGFICTFFIYVFQKILKSWELLLVFVIVTSRKLSTCFHFRIQSCIVLMDLDCSGCLKTVTIVLCC